MSSSAEDELRDELTAALSALVMAAPACTLEQVALGRRLALELALAFAARGRAQPVALACAIERCLELLVVGELELGMTLPPLVMAAASASESDAVVAAATYEVETLLPVPGRAPRARAGGPDVPLGALTRRAPAPAPTTDEPIEACMTSAPASARELVERARQRLRP